VVRCIEFIRILGVATQIGQRERLGMSYLFVSHDLNVVRMVTDRVLVMYLGKIVESGPADDIFDRSAHPYTRALVSAAPALDPFARRVRIPIRGEPRSPIDPSPMVCRFFGRCPDGFDRCEREMPVLQLVAPAPRVEETHEAACHLLEGDPVGDLARR
jgi:oligopeptide/dipeptide ABC transporter ATP-binding protein